MRKRPGRIAVTPRKSNCATDTRSSQRRQPLVDSSARHSRTMIARPSAAGMSTSGLHDISDAVALKNSTASAIAACRFDARNARKAADRIGRVTWVLRKPYSIGYPVYSQVTGRSEPIAPVASTPHRLTAPLVVIPATTAPESRQVSMMSAPHATPKATRSCRASSPSVRPPRPADMKIERMLHDSGTGVSPPPSAIPSLETAIRARSRLLPESPLMIHDSRDDPGTKAAISIVTAHTSAPTLDAAAIASCLPCSVT